jgi:acetate kinase
MTMAPTILVLNAGSSSIKFQLFTIEDGAPQRQYRGQIEGIGTQPRLMVVDAKRAPVFEQTFELVEVADVPSAIEVLRDFLREHLADRLPVAVGHRVVHGGPDFDRPVLVDDEVMDQLRRYVPLAPLHQPNNLVPIEAIRERLPEMLQVACFDTAFHRSHSELADRYAIPDELHQLGARRYGFHGLSYEYIAKVLPDAAPEVAVGRVIAAHLGSGASMCAIQEGCSVDSSMGFTALDGLPMGTRTGQIDPGIVLLLITHKGMSPQQVEQLLYHECGLKGISGISNDVRDLLASDDPRARLALDVFAFRAAKEVGALTSVLGGLDALVFTAGVGENAPEVRKDICDRLAWLGISLDDAANAQNATLISRQGTKPRVYIIPTDEERMIAMHTLQFLGTHAAA